MRCRGAKLQGSGLCLASPNVGLAFLSVPDPELFGKPHNERDDYAVTANERYTTPKQAIISSILTLGLHSMQNCVLLAGSCLMSRLQSAFIHGYQVTDNKCLVSSSNDMLCNSQKRCKLRQQREARLGQSQLRQW